MSVTYSLFCPETKLKIWVGQSDYIYHDETGDIAAFLHQHRGKHLIFESDFFDEDEGFIYEEYHRNAKPN